MNIPDQSPTAIDAHLRQMGVGLALLGLLAGFLIGFGTLLGDEQGRVNLLFLLLVFAFLPVVSLILSLIFLLRSGGRGLAGWLLELPLWPRHLSASLLELEIQHCRKDWLVHQGQVLGLSFSLGTLFVFLLLLLGTDISFVWRSTILESSDLLPVLQFISWPWLWWGDAQPSLQLLEQTRDFRLGTNNGVLAEAGQWWRFILAVQVCYSLFPRSLLWFYTRQRIRSLRANGDSGQSDLVTTEQKPVAAPVLAEVIETVESPWTLLVWGGIDQDCLKAVQSIYGAAERVEQLTAMSQAPIVESSVVVLVKSWEPPMAELGDVLLQMPQQGQRLLLPVDWSNSSLNELRPVHFAEWRRFAATLEGWQILNREAQ